MMASKWIVLMGVAGSGKGTQSEYLARDHNFVVISVGELLRSNKDKVIDNSGETIGRVITSGALLPDGVVLDLVKTELEKIDNVASKNVLFDGFPRTPGQAEALNKIAGAFGKQIDCVLRFVIDDDIVTKRIMGRYKCSKCGKIYNDYFLKPVQDGICDVCGGTEFDRRADDNEESLKMRLKEYHTTTVAVVDYYSKMGVLKEINADADFETVKKSVLESLILN